MISRSIEEDSFQLWEVDGSKGPSARITIQSASCCCCFGFNLLWHARVSLSRLKEAYMGCLSLE